MNNGNFLSLSIPEGSKVTDSDGIDYTLERIEFHTPAEHRIRGLIFPLEMQFHHVEKSSGRRAAISVLVKDGAQSLTLGTFLDQAPSARGERKMHAALNPQDLLPKVRTYYLYTGSLTSPPCTEGVLWWVLDNYYHASEDQINQFKMLFPAGNARPLQLAHGRAPEEFRTADDAKAPIK